jgi:hypothetical protein
MQKLELCSAAADRGILFLSKILFALSKIETTEGLADAGVESA